MFFIEKRFGPRLRTRKVGFQVSMDTPRDEIRYGIGRPLAAGRERRPVVQIDQRQLAGSRDDDVAAENIQTRGGGGPVCQAL